MKTLNDYMAMSYRMEIVGDKDEGGFVVSYPDLPGCITEGNSLKGAINVARKALGQWRDHLVENKEEIPKPSFFGIVKAGKDETVILVRAV